MAIAWSLFQLYAVVTGFLHPMILYPVHVCFALSLVFLNHPAAKGRRAFRFIDATLVGCALVIGVCLILSFPRLSTRIAFVHDPTGADIVLGISLVILLLEACRRTVGWSLTVIAGVFMAYGFAGRYMPGLLAHRGLSLDRFVDLQVLSPNGIFGLPTGVSAELVFYFILFGAFLERSGGGALFSDLAYAVTGRVRGGAAKASVVSSSLYGTISGSAVANVVVDGMFTIPLMKRSGFRPAYAAAVEAAASTGGQLMPPIMGAAAFLLAQMVGISYWEVAIAAAVPACLYYLGLFFAIDFEAARRGFRGLTREEMPVVGDGRGGRLHLLIPLAIMVYYIISGAVTPVTAAFRAIVATLVVSFLRRATRMGPARVLDALQKAGREATSVAVPCAVAGMVIGVLVHSGLGLKFTELMIQASGGILMVSLLLVMVSVIILGMGMPTSAAYLLGAILMAPALVGLGVAPLAAHLFILYFAVISMITPPVALAAYAAASISGSDLWETGNMALRIAVPGFLIPYIFVFHNGLLLRGTLPEVVWVVLTTGMGVVALAGALTGYFAAQCTALERAVLVAGALSLIVPEMVTDLVGLGALAGIFALQRSRKGGRGTRAAGGREGAPSNPGE
jgi:TRAP transporter 4TM/12TM fusion protein